MLLPGAHRVHWIYIKHCLFYITVYLQMDSYLGSGYFQEQRCSFGKLYPMFEMFEVSKTKCLCLHNAICGPSLFICSWTSNKEQAIPRILFDIHTCIRIDKQRLQERFENCISFFQTAMTCLCFSYKGQTRINECRKHDNADASTWSKTSHRRFNECKNAVNDML